MTTPRMQPSRSTATPLFCWQRQAPSRGSPRRRSAYRGHLIRGWFWEEQLGGSGGTHPRLAALRLLSGAELEYAFGGILDGGVRSNQRSDVYTNGGNESRISSLVGSHLWSEIATRRRSMSGGRRSFCSAPREPARAQSCGRPAHLRPAFGAGRKDSPLKAWRGFCATRRGPRASRGSILSIGACVVGLTMEASPSEASAELLFILLLPKERAPSPSRRKRCFHLTWTAEEPRARSSISPVVGTEK